MSDFNPPDTFPAATRGGEYHFYPEKPCRICFTGLRIIEAFNGDQTGTRSPETQPPLPKDDGPPQPGYATAEGYNHTEAQSQRREPQDHDVVTFIPNMYRVLDLIQEKGSGGLGTHAKYTIL